MTWVLAQHFNHKASPFKLKQHRIKLMTVKFPKQTASLIIQLQVILGSEDIFSRNSSVNKCRYILNFWKLILYECVNLDIMKFSTILWHPPPFKKKKKNNKKRNCILPFYLHMTYLQILHIGNNLHKLIKLWRMAFSMSVKWSDEKSRMSIDLVFWFVVFHC